MFTVKATYRNETRKFIFQDPAFFPSYEQLYNQLYRVFPISHSYYLSKLLFSPHTNSGRILIGMEAHSAEEYGAHIAPYQGRTWPGALLRFSVYDETPHKSPGARASMTLSNINVATLDDDLSDTAVEGTSRGFSLSSDRIDRRVLLERILERANRLDNGPLHSAWDEPLDATIQSAPTSSSSRPLPPRPHSDGNLSTGTGSTATARPSLFDLLTPDKRAPPRPTSLSTWTPDELRPIIPSPPVLPSLPVPPPPILYPTVTVRSRNDAAVSAHPGADVVMTSPSLLAASYSGSHHSIAQSREAAQQTLPAQPEPMEVHDSDADATSEAARSSLPRHCCSVAEGKAEVEVLITKFMNAWPLPPWQSHSRPWLLPESSRNIYDIPVPQPLPVVEPMIPPAPLAPLTTGPTFGTIGLQSDGDAAVECAVVHEGITCDACKQRDIKGVRFKCMQCFDYDLCGACMSSPSVRELHDTRHTFFPIDVPDRLSTFFRVKDLQEPMHFGITCDACDQHNIRGVRHKCLECADYDLCSSCMNSPAQRSKHDASHAFFPITVPGEKDAYYCAQGQLDRRLSGDALVLRPMRSVRC
ncbi:ZZ-type zinc finger-containing protein P35G2.11c [Grifola frondosa]|uniref:ZZ-type zinc finger-containing protein P35G2.11c n=1 Tax=Grifola frondosa TaxID=5627 RepID=A0A1C7MSI4_GRIFR|nr:ZZ-type zinc finger-containing protein P35G2.11c [Grifola frondosa]